MKEQLLELIFPPRCAVCTEVLDMEERRGILCRDCAEQLPYVPKGICPHCGGVTETTGFCDFCLKEFAFESACAAFPYETVRRAIHLFKYDGGKKIGDGLGQLLADYMEKYHEAILAKTDFVLSVPLHPKKEKKRGFNQTHILCEQLSARTGLPFRRDILVRKRETAAQSTLDSSKQRRQNLKNAFAVTEDLTGKQVLLVDDIFTTGTTCNECAKELYRAGAQKVFICCLSAAGRRAEP